MIRKEERIGGQRLILGDCLEVMPLLGKVDAVVTDPPYGIGADQGKTAFGKSSISFKGGKPVKMQNRPFSVWDTRRPSQEAFTQILSISGHQIIWGGNYFANMLPARGRWLWWDKCQTMPTYGDGELAWTSLNADTPKKFTLANNKLFAQRIERHHPTQKPLLLMEWCLGFLPNARTILDPFAGSGTTLVACQRLGRQGIGIELDPDYFEIACKRVDEATRQPDLFVSTPTPATQEAMDL